MSNGNKQFMSISRQTWYLVGVLIILAIVAWALMRSGSFASPSNAVLGQPATSTGATTVTKNNKTGTASKTGVKLPSGWPADAPNLHTKASIEYTGTLNPKTGVMGPTVIYGVQSTPQDAINYFKSEFAREGWTFRGQGNAEGSVQLTATKDTRKLTVSILEVRTGTISVTMGISKL